ncbi:Hypothetical predicted protein [Lecanosticta acicola]|uniref:Uncharacterized protein n=1 Tax=Lecanosticta acicola TaxID=111012 RepID=A0AAI8YUP7_9PEZI|nr:Hypothetical predicted protein [Lecanosticta acicola]
MPYLTPPPTVQKGIFTQQLRPEYYEDIYGEINPDEDQHAERCESESESDGDRGERYSQSRDYQRLFGGYEKTQQEGKDGEAGETSRQKYKIAPRLNSRQSVLVQRRKTLVPQKFGMFGEAAEHADGDGDSEKDGADVFATGTKRKKLVPVIQRKLLPKSVGMFGSPMEASGDMGESDENFLTASEKRKVPPAVVEISDGGSEDETALFMPLANDPSRRTGAPVRRPAHRQLISQQLAEREKERKMAKRKGRAEQIELRKKMKSFRKGEAVVVVDKGEMERTGFLRYDG